MSYQLKSIDGLITELHGRLGNFIFRTRNGKIFAFYQPKHPTSTGQHRDLNETITSQLREITRSLNLQIVNES